MNAHWTASVTPEAWQSLTERHKTPLYVYDVATLKGQCEALRSAFSQAEIRYAMKANSNPWLLKRVRQQGLGIDAVSPWELRLARKCGFASDQVLYTPSFPSDDDLRAAYLHDVVLNADSPGIFQRYGKIVSGLSGDRSRPARVALRVDLEEGAGHHAHVVTAGAESKFGLTLDQLDAALDAIAHGPLKLIGLHQHIGSGLLTAEHKRVWLRSAERLFSLAKTLERTANSLDFIDIGGGFGVAYHRDEQAPSLSQWGAEVQGVFESYWPNARKRPRLVIEPGRFVVAECGAIVTRVTTIKRARDRVWVGVDAGMHTLVRPAMYGSYHPIWPVVERPGSLERCFVVGPICESGDVLGAERMMPVPREGDLLIVGVAGAYGYAMASTYNLRPLPAELALDDGEFRLLRKRTRFRSLIG
jgi:diaminopimelate decarboxylase